VTAQCGGTLSFFNNANCSGQGTDLVADGACHPTNLSNTNGFSSYVFRPSTTNVACAAVAPQPTNVQLANEMTVCCPQ
jgi:hypothetical protein